MQTRHALSKLSQFQCSSAQSSDTETATIYEYKVRQAQLSGVGKKSCSINLADRNIHKCDSYSSRRRLPHKRRHSTNNQIVLRKTKTSQQKPVHAQTKQALRCRRVGESTRRQPAQVPTNSHPKSLSHHKTRIVSQYLCTHARTHTHNLFMYTN